ncbi:hypothetical protein GUJ93_ZPchr0001g31299 [Zizania palustris]|uniref:Uncharacterized protein n=1 Tax=Zizania palustris TaxID=103762 RepID=A0A8J5VQQ1_ZIZPA|nr:hypothetical protein GUJ93_ZPchr0001g31299 [Zizania palustris]
MKAAPRFTDFGGWRSQARPSKGHQRHRGQGSEVLEPHFMKKLQHPLADHTPCGPRKAHQVVLRNLGGRLKERKPISDRILSTEDWSPATSPQALQNSSQSGGGFVDSPDDFDPKACLAAWSLTFSIVSFSMASSEACLVVRSSVFSPARFALPSSEVQSDYRRSSISEAIFAVASHA